jgi:hypothetical protein
VGWLWGIGALVLVSLPGIRTLVSEQWAPVIGLAVTLGWLTSVTVLVQWGIAYGLGIVAVSVLTLFRRRLGWTQWVPYGALAVGAALFVTSTIVAIVQGVHRADDLAAQYAADHDLQVAKLRPDNPRAMVFALVDAVMKTDATRGCFLFDPTAAAQFAAAHHVPDCPAALAAIRTQVTYPRDWQNNLWIPSDAEAHPAPGMATLDACRLTFDSAIFDYHPNPGPQLGRFTLASQYGVGWLITGYQGCPAGS